MGGASRGNGTLVTIQTAIVTDLQKKGAVAEGVAAFDAFAATVTELFVDSVLIIRVFYKFAFDGAGGAEFVFGAFVDGVGFGFEKSGAEVAIAAHGEGVDTFNSRFLQDTIAGAVSAGNAGVRIDLPDGGLGATAADEQPCRTANTQ